MDHLPVPVGQFDARPCWRLVNQQRGGGAPRTARKSRTGARPRRRRRPTGQWYGGPCPEPPPWPRTSILELGATGHTTSPAPGGVGSGIVRRRKSLASICHCWRNRSMSLTPITRDSALARPSARIWQRSCNCPVGPGWEGSGCQFQVSLNRSTNLANVPGSPRSLTISALSEADLKPALVNAFRAAL